MPEFDETVRYGDTGEAGVGHRLALIHSARRLSRQVMADVAGAGLSTHRHHGEGASFPRPRHVEAWRWKVGAGHNFIHRGDCHALPVQLAREIEAMATGDAAC